MQIVDGRRAPELARGEVLAISCLSFVTAQVLGASESMPGRARKRRRYRALTQKWYRIVTS